MFRCDASRCRLDPSRSMWNLYSNRNVFPQGGDPYLDMVCSQYSQFGGEWAGQGGEEQGEGVGWVWWGTVG